MLVVVGVEKLKLLEFWFIEGDSVFVLFGVFFDQGDGFIVILLDMCGWFKDGVMFVVLFEFFGGFLIGKLMGLVVVSGKIGV